MLPQESLRANYEKRSWLAKGLWNLVQHYFQQGVCHRVALPFTFKSILINSREELWKLKYFTMQKYDLEKIL
jgi:hypothetical protein